MTLFILGNLYAQDLLLHNVAIKRFTICLDWNDESLLRGELNFWRPRVEKIEGGNRLQAGEPTP